MSNSEKIPNDVKTFLRSVLISSNGVKESKLEKDYRELSGEKIMWRKYGFKSLKEFLLALPDVCLLQYSAKDKENRVYAVQLEGIYMSSHAKKNAKIAKIHTLPSSTMPKNGTVVKQDGETLKIALSNTQEESDSIVPDQNGLYQVYVVKLPETCTENDLRHCFQQYGNIVKCQVIRSSIGRKVGFVSFALKDEALRALKGGKNIPPKIHGVELEVAKPKRKSKNNNFELSSSEGSISSTPASQLKQPTIEQMSSAEENENVCNPDIPTPLSTKPISHEYLPLNHSPLPLNYQSVPLNSQTLLPTTESVLPQCPTLPQKSQPLLLNGPTMAQNQGSSSLNELTESTHKQPQNKKTPLFVEVPVSTIAQTVTSKQRMQSFSSATKTSLSMQRGPMTKRTDCKGATKTFSSQSKTGGTNAVIINGYDSKVTEENLKMIFSSVLANIHVENLKYQPLFSMAWFNNEEDAMQAVNELNGKFVNGCVLLVKPLTGQKNRAEVEPARSLPNEEKLLDLQYDFGKIYDFYSEAISHCSGEQYLRWLQNLPSIFEVKIMDIIDPCTYWVHLYDGTNAYQEFNQLTHQLSLLTPGLTSLKRNEFGAGKFSVDGLWYRCYCGNEIGNNVYVLYIDYGNTEWLARNKTVKLDSAKFFQLRPQGILAKLAGMKFESNEKFSNDNQMLIAAKKILLDERFHARKVSLNSSKPFLLEIELLQSKGESAVEQLTALPGVEICEKEFSPAPSVLLSSLPPIPTDVKPLNDSLSHVDSPVHFIRITDIKSPTSFYFQLVRNETASIIKRIQELLFKCNLQSKIAEKVYSQEERQLYLVNVKDLKINAMVCYHKNGLQRSRVSVLGPSGTPGKVTIRHVDTGKEAVVPLTSFISLPAEAENLYYLARPAKLFGVSHDNLSQSSEALEFMILQATQILRAIVVDEDVDESVCVELFNSEGTSINKVLRSMVNQEAFQTKAVHNMSSQHQELPSPSHLQKPILNSIRTQNQAVSTSIMSSPMSSQPLVYASKQDHPTTSLMPGHSDQIFGDHHIYPQNITTPNQKQPNNMLQTSSQGLTVDTVSTFHKRGQQRVQPYLASPQIQVSPNQTFTRNPAPAYNQALPHNQEQLAQAPSRIMGSSDHVSEHHHTSPRTQISSSQKNNLIQTSSNASFLPEHTPPNQSFSERLPQRPNEALTSKRISPQAQISPSHNLGSRQELQQEFSQGSTNRTFVPTNRPQPNAFMTQTSDQSLLVPSRQGLATSQGGNKMTNSSGFVSRVAPCKSQYATSQKPLTVPGLSESSLSGSLASQNSFHLNVNCDDRNVKNVYETKANLNKVKPEEKSAKNNSNIPKDKVKSRKFGKLQSNTSVLPAPSNKKAPRAELHTVKGGGSKTEKKSKQINPGGTSVTQVVANPAMNDHSLTETGGRAFTKPDGEGAANLKKLQSLKTKLNSQEKVLSSSGEELRQNVEMYKRREKLNLIYKVKMLENENLMLKGEIKKQLEEKATLEKQLQQQL